MQTIFYSIMVFFGSVVALSTIRPILKNANNPKQIISRPPQKLIYAAFIGLLVGVFYAQALQELLGAQYVWVKVLGILVGFAFAFLGLNPDSNIKKKR